MAGHATPTEVASKDAQHRPEPVVEAIWSGVATLGECPLWDGRRGLLFWIDSLQQKVWACGPHGEDPRCWSVPDVIGSIGLCRDERLIAGCRRGFGIVTLGDGGIAAIEWLGDPEPERLDNRLNDGKVDRAGRFWCGSMHEGFVVGRGALYRLDPDLRWHRVDSGFTVSNGLAFSPDGTRLYFSDSREDRSYQYDLDPRSGAAAGRRAFVDTTAYAGRIDGATVDADGNYWAALFEGGAVACFSPDGVLLRRIALPVGSPTMCCFGGPGLETLFVTSATFHMTGVERDRDPQSGSLFAVRGLGVGGLEEPRFAYPP